MAYSTELKQAAVNAYISSNQSIKNIANTFNVGSRTLKTWLSRYRQGEQLTIPIPGRPSKLNSDQKEFVATSILNNPDITLVSLCSMVFDEFGIELGESAMCRIVMSLGFRKKKKSYLPLEALRDDIKKKK